MYIRRDLGDLARLYMIKKVIDGKDMDMMVSRYVVERIAKSYGSVYGYYPSDLDESSCYNFEEGGVVEYEEAHAILASQISKYLMACPDNVVIVEDVNLEKGAPCLKEFNVTIKYCGNKVCYYLANVDSVDDDKIREALYHGEGWLANIYFSRAVDCESSDEKDDDFFLSLARSANLVVSNAYDFDGYVYMEIIDSINP